MTITTTKGYGSRIMDSIKGVFIGFGLFIASFFVLYLNEGSVDLSKIAILSVESEQGVNYEGQFISKSGEVYSDEKIGDDDFISKGDYIFIDRKTEMFSWVEKTETKTKENIGGSETTTTTYSYEKEWKESVDDSSRFKETGHNNPDKNITSLFKKVTSGTIDNYTFSTDSLRLPKGEDLNIKDELLVKEEGKKLSKIEIYKLKSIAKKEGKEYIEEKTEEKLKYQYTNKYIFVGSGTLNNPEIGNIRISYKIFNNNSFGTIFGKSENNNIVKYNHNEESYIFHLFDKNREESITELHKEYTSSLWLIRGIGFLMMWIGLVFIMNIFSTLLAVIPFLANVGRFLIFIITFFIALVLSLITILIGIIAHNIFLLIGILILLLVGAGFYINKYRKKKDLNKNISEIKKEETYSPEINSSQNNNINKNISEIKKEETYSPEINSSQNNNINKNIKEDDTDGFTVI